MQPKHVPRLAKQGTLQAPKDRRARFKTCKARNPASPEGPQTPFQDLSKQGTLQAPKDCRARLKTCKAKDPASPEGPQSPLRKPLKTCKACHQKTARARNSARICSASPFQELAKQETLQAPKNCRDRSRTCKARDPASPEGPQSPFQDSQGTLQAPKDHRAFPRLAKQETLQAPKDRRAASRLAKQLCKNQNLLPRRTAEPVPRLARDPASPKGPQSPFQGLQGTLQAPKDRRARFKTCKANSARTCRPFCPQTCFSLKTSWRS